MSEAIKNLKRVIQKAKYISRKRVGSKWVYKYKEDQGKSISGNNKEDTKISGHISQDDAEFVADLYNALSGMHISTGVVSPTIKQAYEKIDEIRRNLHQQVFSENSKWATKIDKKGKAIVYEK